MKQKSLPQQHNNQTYKGRLAGPPTEEFTESLASAPVEGASAAHTEEAVESGFAQTARDSLKKGGAKVAEQIRTFAKETVPAASKDLGAKIKTNPRTTAGVLAAAGVGVGAAVLAVTQRKSIVKGAKKVVKAAKSLNLKAKGAAKPLSKARSLVKAAKKTVSKTKSPKRKSK